ncbi:MAG: alpha/beta hydrolase [Gloeobacteraceae cyanobacterium ES-bin-316]|nr:alpha/beta hydrolase [Ferruginibacter sp.]
MKAYFISGLAADCRVFKYIQLPPGYETVFLDWISPLKNESLQAYSFRMAESIDTSQPFVLVGLSMGGMIATEIANKYQPVACILLSSVPTHKQMPGYFKLAYVLKLHRLVPIGLLQKASIMKRGLAPDNKADKELLKQVIKDSDPAFIRWAMNAILCWKNETIPKPLWHIHGRKDEILPYRYTKPTHSVEGGNHVMIMSKAGELNKFLKEVLAQEDRNS